MTDITKNETEAWSGGEKPFVASYGKLMMWFFLVSDALTFSGFLAAYGFMRFKYAHLWPVAEDVFTHFPFLHGDHPLLFVALMTFILIMSSVTMVLAVNAGNKNDKKGVTLWMLLTIIGGFTFLGSQAWEWGHFIHGDKGGIELPNHEIVHVVDADAHFYSIYDLVGVDSYAEDVNITIDDVKEALAQRPDLGIRLSDKSVVSDAAAQAYLNNAEVVLGANLVRNEYGHQLFANFFYFITGFHGFHVFSGVVILIVIFINVIKGTYERRGHYEMVEKVGLYWHFVDLVWVFVFTFFYLV
ncbi:cytochrome c oxidase subunit 3 [Flavobacteriales bacterium]|nr:cytochrome c oxidase subunit 3 [Flavobacteriales bacterium]